MNAPLPNENSEQRSARYADLMRYPEWRVFAWQCKDQRGCVCESCGPEKGRRPASELEVHHWWYDLERWPWEYAVQDVAVLCAACHAEYHAQLKAWESVLRARWVRSERERKQFMADFRRFVFPGLTTEGMRRLNMSMGLGMGTGEAQGGPLAAEVLGVLMGGASNSVAGGKETR
jgi:hypothetical protein